MIKILTYGTFDLLHYGHLNLLKRCANLGDELYVGVSTDEFAKQKGKCTVYNTEKRIEMISDLKYVTLAFPEYSMTQKIEDCKKYNIDIFVLGDDYKDTFKQMPEYNILLELGVKVIFLERTPNISTTKLKENLKNEK